MEIPSASPSFLERLQAAANRNRKQEVAAVAAVADVVTSCNHNDNDATVSVSPVVAGGLQAFRLQDVVASQSHHCFGCVCQWLQAGDEPHCLASGKGIFQIYIQDARCPHGYWRRRGIRTAASHGAPARCGVCGGGSWWRLPWKTEWTCERCHPPVAEEGQYNVIRADEAH